MMMRRLKILAALFVIVAIYLFFLGGEYVTFAFISIIAAVLILYLDHHLNVRKKKRDADYTNEDMK